MYVYVGAYTESPLGHGEGIYVFDFDPTNGELTPNRIIRNVANPSFLVLDAEQRFLYAVNELDEGYVSAFARDPQSGDLTFINKQPSHGAAPCYISLDTTSRFALVANYTGGTIAVLPIAQNGSLQPASTVIRHEGSSVHPSRQEGPHPHMIAVTPDDRFVLATDLGADQIVLYELDTTTGKLSPATHGSGFAKTDQGAGPRHFAFAPNGKSLYVINELASTLTVYEYDAERGELRPRQTVSSLPEDFAGENTGAQVLVSPDGRFVYGSNRGHHSITIWSVDAESGALSLVGHESTRGEGPRNFTIDPTGSWLIAANERSDTVVTFRRDQESGMLTATGQPVEVPTPVAVLFSGH